MAPPVLYQNCLRWTMQSKPFQTHIHPHPSPFGPEVYETLGRERIYIAATFVDGFVPKPWYSTAKATVVVVVIARVPDRFLLLIVGVVKRVAFLVLTLGVGLRRWNQAGRTDSNRNKPKS